jgi:hypothetical protein
MSRDRGGVHTSFSSSSVSAALSRFASLARLGLTMQLVVEGVPIRESSAASWRLGGNSRVEIRQIFWLLVTDCCGTKSPGIENSPWIERLVKASP